MNNAATIGSDIMTAYLQELEEASGELKTALIKRNVEEIWKALASQEKVVSWFYENLEAGNSSDTTEDTGDKASENKGIIARIRRIQSTNQALASAFLKVIDRTLDSLSDVQNSKTGTYGCTGAMEKLDTPVLVQQHG